MSSAPRPGAADRSRRLLAELVEAGDERQLRAALCRLLEPEEERGPVDRLVDEVGAVAALRRLLDPREPADARAAEQLAPRLARLDLAADAARALDADARFVVPGDDEWPQLALTATRLRRPFGLWLRGPLDLAVVVEQAVAVVGSRASTAYGEGIAADLAAGLALRGWAVVSGAAFGIDAAAHRGALAVNGPTVAVLASGVDRPYPARHTALIDRIAAEGLVVSELAPGEEPRRLRFLARNRLVAALSRGTVVVEAGERSGTRTTARLAKRYGRTVMAVPGPVTSWASRGCHELLRWPEDRACLVTCAEDVVEAVTRPREDSRRSEATPWDELPAAARRLLDALPARDALPLGEALASSGLLLDELAPAVLALVDACQVVVEPDGGLRRPG